MTVKLLTEHQLEFLSLKGGCTGSSESTHIKMPHCLKSRATAHMYVLKRSTMSYFNVKRRHSFRGFVPYTVRHDVNDT